MSRRFIEYKDAYDAAQKLATECKIDTVIRGVKEYGKLGYNVSFASRNDSDYARYEIYEIVRPGSPKCV